MPPWGTLIVSISHELIKFSLSKNAHSDPTQVIFKCCKLIPVLIGGILIQGKRYGLIDVLAAGMMSLGEN